MLQQFSIVISHWSWGRGGQLVSGVTFLLTMIRFLIRGLLRRTHTFLSNMAIATNCSEHTPPSVANIQRLTVWACVHDCASSPLKTVLIPGNELLSSGCSSYWPAPTSEGHLYKTLLCHIGVEHRVGYKFMGRSDNTIQNINHVFWWAICFGCKGHLQAFCIFIIKSVHWLMFTVSDFLCVLTWN